MKMKKEDLARMIDHTLLKPDATRQQIEKHCKEAVQYGFHTVCINPYWTKPCKELVKGTGVAVGAAVGFPLGQTTIEDKVFETMEALTNGADEIDYVLNISALKNGDYSYLEKEMQDIKMACRAKNAVLKVIFETCYLDRDEIILAATIARNVRPDFVKTSTGFGKAGATAEHVRLMKETVGAGIEVKAAGGIRSLASCMEMIEAGASRIGTSSGIAILQEMGE